MTRRIDCNQQIGTPYDAVHLTVTVDGEQVPLETRVTFTRVRDRDPETGKLTGPLLTGLLLSGEPQYDVDVFADGAPVAQVKPQSDETEHIYARVAEVEAEEAKVSERLATMRRRRPG
jgi:hypothetical protein